jgi:hypothetical protein
MLIRYLLTGAIAATLASGAAAEPAKPEVRESAPAANREPQVLLASADTAASVLPQAPETAAVPAKRPRAARVTTCRCANQAAAPERSPNP